MSPAGKTAVSSYGLNSTSTSLCKVANTRGTPRTEVGSGSGSPTDSILLNLDLSLPIWEMGFDYSTPSPWEMSMS